MGCGRSKDLPPIDVIQRIIADCPSEETETFYTQSEVEELFFIWIKLGGGFTSDGQGSHSISTVPAMTVIELPELTLNPFKYRIIKVFSESKKTAKISRRISLRVQEREELKNVRVTFLQFVRMAFAFSHRAGFHRKSKAAFKVYDFDDNGYIEIDDVVEIVRLICGDAAYLSPKQLVIIAKQILEEADDDGNFVLSEDEFRKVMMRIPEFAGKFQFNLNVRGGDCC